jgi:hypothetical protein
MDVYRTVAWLGWIPNLLLAEYIILRNGKKRKLRFSVARNAKNTPH